MGQFGDDGDLDDVLAEMVDYVEADASTTIDVPAGMADAEAVHAVQKQYADAGFECDESTARAIVGDAR